MCSLTVFPFLGYADNSGCAILVRNSMFSYLKGGVWRGSQFTARRLFKHLSSTSEVEAGAPGYGAVHHCSRAPSALGRCLTLHKHIAFWSWICFLCQHS